MLRRVLFAGMIYFLAGNAVYFVTLLAGVGEAELRRRRRKKERHLLDSEYPGITILAPAFNMETSILDAVSGMLRLDYPNYEVIIINDGSTDKTLELIEDAYALVPERIPPLRGKRLSATKIIESYRAERNPRLRVIDKINAGSKADALNAGIPYARHGLICVLDADSLLEKSSLREIARPFVLRPESTVATGGTIRVINGSSFRDGAVRDSRVSRKPIVLFQIIEYLRAFYGGRIGWDRFNALLIISGAFGLFKTDALIEVGGYDGAGMGEDMELVLRLRAHYLARKRGCGIEFVPEATCWTEVPASLTSLYHQRNRWQRGLIDSLVKNDALTLNPRAGAVGLIAIPYFVLIEFLGPLVEFVICMALVTAQLRHMLTPGFWWRFVEISLLASWALSFAAVALERQYFARYRKNRDYVALLVGSLFEPLGYRQLIALFRLVALGDWVRGNKNWGKLKRRGFGLARGAVEEYPTTENPLVAVNPPPRETPFDHENPLPPPPDDPHLGRGPERPGE